MAIILSLPFVQTKLGRIATDNLNKEFSTDLTIDKIAISPFGTVKLGDVLIRDHHKDTLFYIQKLNTSILNLKALYTDGHPYLGDVTIHGLDAKLKEYKGEGETNLDKFIDAFDDGSPSSGRFRMKVSTFDIYNSRFRYIDETLDNPKLLDFTGLNGKLNDFFIKGPNVYTKIERLAFHDHRGLDVQKISSNFTYTKQNILLENFYARSKESYINGRVELLYNREDFSDFNNKVKWDAQLEKVIISSNDLNHFYNEFGINNKFYFQTNLKGTLNNFTTQNLKLVDENKSEIIGEVTFVNLFNKEASYKIIGDFDRVSSNYSNLRTILPNLLGNNLPTSLVKLGQLNLNGNVELTNHYIISNVYLLSSLGIVDANINIQNIENIDNANYSGELILKNFNIGKLIDNKDLGKITADINVNGKGFIKEYLNTKVKGNIHNVFFNGYDYTKITVDGTMKMPYYKGYFNSNDPNLRMDFDGLLDLSSKIKNFDFTSYIDYADLTVLNFNKNDSISIFKGNISMNSKGNSFDDLEGILNLKNVSYQNNKKQYFFTDFNVSSSFDEENVRTIFVNSPDIITGRIFGKYKLNQVSKILENAVGSLYANFSPNKLEEGQFLDFNFYIHNKIVEIFVPEVSISENTKIKGKIDADKGKFELDFSSPNIIAYQGKFDNIKIDIDNKNPLYNTFIEMDSLRLNKYKISNFNLINLTLNDTLFLRSEFLGGSQNQDQYSLNLYHTIDSTKKSIIGFKKSEVKLRDYLWFINENETKDNKVVFSKDLQNFDFQKVSLSHKDQKMSFFGTLTDSTYKDLNLSFHDVDLEKIIPAIDSLQFNGKLNGYASLKQANKIYKPKSNIQIDSLKINKYTIGDFSLNVEGNDDFNKFLVNSNIIQDNEERFTLSGDVNYENKETTLDLEAGLNNFELAPFGPLLTDIVSNVRGEASGRATIRGNIVSPEIDGRLYLTNSGLTIPYLNTDYNFEKNAIVDVTEHQFLFRNIKITDSKYNTSGTLNGSVRHEAFDDWEIDLEVRSKNILALDTKDGDDVYYYGTAFMNGFASIKGPVNALYVNVVGESEKGTSIKIPVNDAEEIGDNSFINFISEDEIEFTNKGIIVEKNNYQGIELDFDFDIDTDAEIEVILDRNSGHAMKGRGYGSMKMEINTLGKFLMYGDFIVEEGDYRFKYGGLIDKKFIVKSGGTIRWEGEPMNAILNLEAVYSTQANPAVLLESASFNRKVNTDVSIVINGSLSNPEPDFNINFPTVSSVMKSEIDYQLQNKDTRQTQALALLSTGSFMTPENAGNAAYGPLFERASSLFSDIFSDEDSKLQLGVDYSQGDRLNQISDRVGVTLATQINDKISINGKVGVPVGGVTESVLVGNVEILMQLNDDGSLKAHVFNRENDINYLVNGIGYTQGIGLTYTVDFNTMKEFIQAIFVSQKNKKETQKDSEQLPDSEFSPDYINFINERKNQNKKKTNSEEIEKVPEIE